MSKRKENNKIQIEDQLNLVSNDPQLEIKVEPKEENDLKEQLTNVEQKIDQQSFTSKKAQKEHIKNINEALKQEALVERVRINEERARLKQTILEIEAEIEKAKLRQTKILEDAKFQEAKIIEEAIKQRRIEEVELQNRKALLVQRQKDIVLIQQQHTKQQHLIKENIEAKKVDANQKLKLGRLQIREELAAKRREIRIRNEEQKQLALELAQQLKEERLKALEAKAESKAKFKQEIVQMKLELYAERKRQQHELAAKKIAARSKRRSEIEEARSEALALKQNRSKIRDDLRLSNIKSKLKIHQKQAELNLEISEHKYDADAIKEEHKNAIQSMRDLNASEIKDLETSKDLLNQGATVAIGTLNAEQKAVRDAKAMDVFKEDYVTLVSEFKGFDKIGSKLLEKVKKPISERKLNKYKNHAYYGPMVQQYIQLQEDGNFASLYTMILGALVISGDEFFEDLIQEKTRTLQKAILQGIPIKVGPYYVMPINKSGIRSFYISHHLKDGEVIFDNHKLFSDATLEALDDIIAYKLELGTSIKIIDGLAIANEGGNLTVAVYPNII